MESKGVVLVCKSCKEVLSPVVGKKQIIRWGICDKCLKSLKDSSANPVDIMLKLINL